MTITNFTPNRRALIAALAAGALTRMSGSARSDSYIPITAQTNIWGRVFKPNSALKTWSISGDGDLAAPNRLRFELRPGDRYDNPSDIQNNRERAELSGSGSPFEFDQAYQFTTSLRLSGYSGASDWLMLLQMIQVVGSATLPILGIEIRKDKHWQIVVRGGLPTSKEQVVYVSPGQLQQGISHALTLKVMVGSSGASQITATLNSSTVFNKSDVAMGFPAGEPPYFKLGLYRPASADKCVMVHTTPRLTAI